MKRKADPDSAVCIAIRYELDDPGIEVGARFSAPVLTGPVPHRVSYKMGTGSFPQVKRPGRGVHRPLPTNAKFKKKSRAKILLPLCVFVAYSLRVFNSHDEKVECSTPSTKIPS